MSNSLARSITATFPYPNGIPRPYFLTATKVLLRASEEIWQVQNLNLLAVTETQRLNLGEKILFGPFGFPKKRWETKAA